MSKKMCIRYKKGQYCPAVDTAFCRRSGTNDNCEIITKKPKYKTINGWASISEEYGGWQFIEQGHGVLSIPAELRIKVKYLNGAK